MVTRGFAAFFNSDLHLTHDFVVVVVVVLIPKPYSRSLVKK